VGVAMAVVAVVVVPVALVAVGAGLVVIVRWTCRDLANVMRDYM
jgi:hypothetical protein